MRAKTKIYHIDCFRCSACSRHLNPGMYSALEQLAVAIWVKHWVSINICNKKYRFSFSWGDEFALREGGSLYCKNDHDNLEKSAQSRVAPIIESNNNTHLNNNNHSSEVGSMSGKAVISVHIFIYFFRLVAKRKKSIGSRIETSCQPNWFGWQTRDSIHYVQHCRRQMR